MFPDRVLSGMRPTGALHLGHFHGVLKNWVKLQHEHPCLFFVADWHALTTHYEEPDVVGRNVWDMVVDWLAAGVDPSQATLFIQSRVPAHSELQGPAGKAVRPRPVHVWLPRLSAAAGRRHSDLPRYAGACRRGPGAA